MIGHAIDNDCMEDICWVHRRHKERRLLQEGYFCIICVKDWTELKAMLLAIKLWD